MIFVFNSPGGSVTSGIAIANKIKALSNRGVKTTAKVEGVCASISTCIACACDKIVMGKGSFFMIHNCWSVVQGDCNTLRKEADLMEKMNEAILSFYRSKFNATDEQLKQWMDEETWISSEDVNDFGLICEVDDNEVEFKIAASINRYDFKHIPEVLNMEDKIEEAVKTGDEVIEQLKDEVVVEAESIPMEENAVEETAPVEAIPNEDDEVLNKEEVLAKYAEYEKTIEQLKNENESLKSQIAEYERKAKANIEVEDDAKELISKEECEKRVSGMQSKMQAKINDFVSQLKVKDEELNTVKAELTSLNQRLEEANGELSKMASALEEKNNALAQLNAGVLRPAEELPTMEDGLAKCATPKERVDFLKSGKFVR